MILWHLLTQIPSPRETPVLILKKGESLKIVLDGRQLNTMIDETKGSWQIEQIQIELTRINGPIFSIADIVVRLYHIKFVFSCLGLVSL